MFIYRIIVGLTRLAGVCSFPPSPSQPCSVPPLAPPAPLTNVHAADAADACDARAAADDTDEADATSAADDAEATNVTDASDAADAPDATDATDAADVIDAGQEGVIVTPSLSLLLAPLSFSVAFFLACAFRLKCRSRVNSQCTDPLQQGLTRRVLTHYSRV